MDIACIVLATVVGAAFLFDAISRIGWQKQAQISARDRVAEAYEQQVQMSDELGPNNVTPAQAAEKLQLFDGRSDVPWCRCHLMFGHPGPHMWGAEVRRSGTIWSVDGPDAAKHFRGQMMAIVREGDS